MFPIYCVSYTLVLLFYSNERFRTIYAAFLTAVCVYTPVLYENKKQEKLAFCLFETFARYSDSARSVNSSILARYYRDKIFRYSLSFFFLFSFLSRRSSPFAPHPPFRIFFTILPPLCPVWIARAIRSAG